MISLLFLSLISQSSAEPSETEEIVYVDFEDVDVEGQLAGPRLTLIAIKPTAKPRLLIPDVRQLFIDKHGKRVTESK
jgi:hypothetical protein